VIPVVATPLHARHAPAVELEHGRAIPPYEHPARADAIEATLRADTRFVFERPELHGIAPIEAVHEPGMVRFLATAWERFQREQAVQPVVVPDAFLHPALREGMGDPPAWPQTIVGELGRWCTETMTPLVEGTWEAATAAVDVALTATDRVLAGAPLAYGLCRPPGHHAARAAFGGYCFVNNAAIAAHHVATTRGVKVTVLDVDYHHGNGTQQIFYARADVQYVSLHADPRRAYPYYAGFAQETGTGAGLGSTHNIELAAGCDDDAYLAALDRACAEIESFRPELVVLSLGVDTFGEDPLSDLALSREAYDRMGSRIAALGLPVVTLQEGGYHVGAIGDLVARTLGTLSSLRPR
jgi:acetoin utilization deacetylase AcuC-like enzyme